MYAWAISLINNNSLLHYSLPIGFHSYDTAPLASPDKRRECSPTGCIPLTLQIILPSREYREISTNDASGRV